MRGLEVEGGVGSEENKKRFNMVQDIFRRGIEPGRKVRDKYREGMVLRYLGDNFMRKDSDKDRVLVYIKPK